MSVKYGKVALCLLVGAGIAFIFQHFLVTYCKRTTFSIDLSCDVKGQRRTKVYRFNGMKFVRLHEFCTWTLNMPCAVLKTKTGTTPIFIHDRSVDRWVSGSLASTGTWEPENVELILSLLEADEELGFLDLGSHVGAFSLSVAKYGRKVVSVDPLIENVIRLCKSIEKGGFTEQMTIIFNPISDHHAIVDFVRVKDNLGGTVVVTPTKKNKSSSSCVESESSFTVLLDDLIPLISFRKAIIKMDVEQHEYQVLSGASRFFNQINVVAILMEWNKMKNSKHRDKLIELLLDYNYTPFESKIKGKILETKNNATWPYDVLWKKSKT